MKDTIPKCIHCERETELHQQEVIFHPSNEPGFIYICARCECLERLLDEKEETIKRLKEKLSKYEGKNV